MGDSENQQATLTWTSVFGGRYYLATDGRGHFCQTTATTCVISGLVNGVTYSFEVAVVYSTFVGAFSAPVTTIPDFRPTSPDQVRATSYQDSQSTVTWGWPTGNGGTGPSSFVVEYLASGSSQLQIVSGCPAFPATHCTVTGLTNGTTDTFQVLAVNRAGETPGLANPITVGIPPAAPTAVQAHTFQSQAITVSYTAPSLNGGLSVQYYTIAAIINGVPTGQTWITTGTSYVVSGLRNATPYTFTVTATNAAGMSVASSPSASATTPAG